jgi:hypothetical protein
MVKYGGRFVGHGEERCNGCCCCYRLAEYTELPLTKFNFQPDKNELVDQ